MKIECSNCNATYEVAENAIPPEGREVQCARCDHIWLAVPMPSDPEPAPAPMQLVQQTPAEPEQSFEPQVEETPPPVDPTLNEEVTGILGAEADFARQQRVEETPTEETSSSLENLRRRVIDENPQLDEPPSEPDTSETKAEPEPTPAAAASSPFSRVSMSDTAPAESVEEASSEDVPAPIAAETETASEPMAAEAEMKPASSSPFRRLGAKPKTDPEPEAEMSPEATEAESTSTEDVAEPAPETAAAPPAPKRRRQSLAEISASSAPAPQIEAGEMPASRPIDLGPASPEERPDTPLDEDVTRRTLEVPRSESIAKPDMSPDAVAQRALEELDAIETKEVDKKRSFAGGFSLGLLLIAALLFIFSFGPIIGEALPITEPFFTAYHDAVEGALAVIGIDLGEIGRTLLGWLEAIQ